MATFDPQALLVGQPLALARSALPALVSHAAARAGQATVEQLTQRFAALPSDRDPSLPRVQRVGATILVPLTGLITPDPLTAWLFGGTTPDGFMRALRQAVESDAAHVLIVTDSPGGVVDLIPEAAAEIRRLRSQKPIAAIARTMMGSAAYWLSAQAGAVYATPSAEIGSVGVFSLHYDASGFNERLGIVPEYIASSPEKVELNPDAPLADSARQFLQARVDETAGQFVSDLAKGRERTVAQVRATFGAGRMFGAPEALHRGMVDAVMSLETALADLVTNRSNRARRTALALDAEWLALHDDPCAHGRGVGPAAVERDRDWLDLV